MNPALPGAAIILLASIVSRTHTTDWLTALGTVAAVAAAVGIAAYGDWRTSTRIADERTH